MNRKKQAAILRTVRSLHRKAGLLLLVGVFTISITGLLLGWKKNVSVIQAPTQQGSTGDMSDWLSMDSLVVLANKALQECQGNEISTEIEKLDVRIDKGIVKVIYANHHHSFQLDAGTGEIVGEEYRLSDLIEQLHDGTWVDRSLGIPSGAFKLIYTSLMGTGLLLFTVTGFWMWYGPKRMRRKP